MRAEEAKQKQLKEDVEEGVVDVETAVREGLIDAIDAINERLDHIEGGNGHAKERTISGTVAPVGEVGSTLEWSDKVDKILPAILVFHRACAGIATKDAENPFYSRPGRSATYATLASLKRVYDEPLAAAELVALSGTRTLSYQTITVVEKGQRYEQNVARVAVSTHIFHAPTGQWVRNTIVMDGTATGPHAMGSLVTYGRRYNMAALLDVAQEDDDGNMASVRGSSAAAPQGGGEPRRQSAGDRAQQAAAQAKPAAPPPAQQQKPAPAPTGEKAKVVAAVRELTEDVKRRVEGDEEAGRTLLREIFENQPRESITTMKQVVRAANLLASHAEFGDKGAS